ncbi:MAG: N-6 DNA methylase [Candidatus Marinimicrobia bacterium]|nr:N-6 DNA methylase [Candidatus Neomarinimicrobiota bacterium]MCF7829348.1 N-6 DNA methylase [Candidatus Neomarinimicrobiota bacterium]MCF7879989.1 N-6 DNA methylase [Candidatus Neomarinimicrobiota bacterium]
MNQYTSITIQGQILSTEVLENLGRKETKYQKPEKYGLKPKESVRDEIQFAYSLARQQWEIFKQRRSRWEEDDTGTSDTRNYWMLPLFDSLGFNLDNAKAEYVNNRSYAISHRDFDRGGFPIHIMSVRDKMDRKRDYGGPRLSPHGLLQEYLNVTEHLYGLVSNGLKLRILRDSTRLSRLSYVEFDLEAMMEDELYTDFATMFRLIHASRMPIKPEESPESIIEAYHQDAIESGARIREKLREKVEVSLQKLGNGFLTHPANNSLRQQFLDENIDATRYYGKLLKIIYRLLFLMVSEERNMIFPRVEGSEWNADLLKKYPEIYKKYYSVNRLRNLAEKKHLLNLENDDLWENLKRSFLLFEKEAYGEKLGIQALNGELFSPSALEPLNHCRLTNGVLLESLDAIARFENEHGQLTRVNYGGLDVEEFGSVYEALLDYEPKVKTGATPEQSREWVFQFAEGTERKTTGSYYTRTELVQELIKSALIPVIEERLEAAGSKEEKIQALLDLKVCDPAAGSGHFLLAAARKIAEYLAKERTEAEQPAPEAYNEALLEVIQHCIYGVDMNPMAVELCKVALWLESHSVGHPLTYLDHHIKCGNSLVGLDELSRLDEGIPDGAFKEVIGDDKETARKLRKRNKKERESGQLELQPSFGTGEKALEQFAENLREIDSMPEHSVEDIQKKAEAYNRFKRGQNYQDVLSAANIWTGAFFIEKTPENVKSNLVPTTQTLHSFITNPRAANAKFTGKMNALSTGNRFFHWPLEFPEVKMDGGFDIVLGNPPWEMPEVDDKTSASDEKALKKFQLFIGEKSNYPKTGAGRRNIYSSFTETFLKINEKLGRIGIIVPTGIVTDNPNQKIARNLFKSKSIRSLYDFENGQRAEGGRFFDIVHNSYHFCLLTIVQWGQDRTDLGFYLESIKEVDKDEKIFQINYAELDQMCPSRFSVPLYKNKQDAELSKKCYKNGITIIGINKKSKDTILSSLLLNFGKKSKSKKVLFSDLHNMENYHKVYEGRYIHQYDNRYSTFITSNSIDNKKVSPEYDIRTEYYISRDHLEEIWESKYEIVNWYIGLRRQARTTDKFSSIASILPKSVSEGNLTAFYGKILNGENGILFLANLNSLVFNYVVMLRQNGPNLNKGVYEQIPLIPFEMYNGYKEKIVGRALQLTYTNNALDEFAAAFSLSGEPFSWDVEKRSLLKSEIDTFYAKLYRLTRDDLRYILDPQDVYGEDFPGETFRVLKNKEMKKYGEYRTKRLVLEAWDRLEDGRPMMSEDPEYVLEGGKASD